MAGLVGIIALLTVLTLSLIITRLAATALKFTGLSEQAARFQARSAFTGTGFTTGEAEKVVNHPVRRRIITLLMIVRSIGLVTVVVSLILSFAGAGSGEERVYRLLWILGGVVTLWILLNNRWVDRGLNRLIERALRRWSRLDTRDYANLLKLTGEYGVNELRIDEDDWLADRKLADCRLRDEGVLVLGIYRSDGSYVGIPTGETEIVAGDTLIVYSRRKTLEELDERQAGYTGEQAHREAVDEQQEEKQKQQEQEEATRRRREAEEAAQQAAAEQEELEGGTSGDSEDRESE